MKKSRTKLQTLSSRHFQVRFRAGEETAWFVRDRDSLSDTADSASVEDYSKLKRIWRRSKEGFDNHCRTLTFRNLFNAAGVEIEHNGKAL